MIHWNYLIKFYYFKIKVVKILASWLIDERKHPLQGLAAVLPCIVMAVIINFNLLRVENKKSQKTKLAKPGHFFDYLTRQKHAIIFIIAVVARSCELMESI